eukprot:3133893-Alexandrium_andersonii.AAC.1
MGGTSASCSFFRRPDRASAPDTPPRGGGSHSFRPVRVTANRVPLSRATFLLVDEEVHVALGSC